MRIAIVGYGKMGHMIEAAIKESGRHEICAIIDPLSDDKNITGKEINNETKNGADVAIDFTAPDSAYSNIERYASLSLPAVIGTTGWLEKLPDAEKLVTASGMKLIYSGNFSIGVAVFLEIVRKAGAIINNIPTYDVAVREVHHRAKKDAPSGTAMMTASCLLDEISRKERIVQYSGGKIDENAIGITSERVGYVPGIHTVTIDGSADTIEITHTARSREGFASGAVKAAEWLVNQNSGIYTMDDFVSSLIGGENA